MSLPGNPTVTVGTCSSATSSGTGDCETDQDVLCLNPVYRLAHTDVCGSTEVSTLRIEPEDSEVATGRRCAVRVIATFDTGQEADVTSVAVIDTEDNDTASYLGSGVVRGSAAGAVWIEATYGGKSARGTVTVATGSEALLDLVLVLDTNVISALPSVNTRSDAGVDTYFLPVPTDFSQGLKYLADAVQGALALTTTLDAQEDGGDRVAIVATGPTGTLSVSGWSSSVVTVEETALQGGRVGKAIEAAETLLDSARSAATKAALVIAAGPESSCNPSVSTAGASLVNAGYKLAIVSPVAAGTTACSSCAPDTQLDDYFQAVTSQTCLYLGGATNANIAGKVHQAIRGLLGEGPCS